MDSGSEIGRHSKQSFTMLNHQFPFFTETIYKNITDQGVTSL